MTSQEAAKVAEIVRSADNFCTECCTKLCVQLKKEFPEFEWFELCKVERRLAVEEEQIWKSDHT